MDGEKGSTTRTVAMGDHLTPVKFNQRLDQGEPQSKAAEFALASALALPEAVENIGEQVRGNALPIVRERVAGMALHRGLDLDTVELYAIAAVTLRLDGDPHRTRLFETARRLRPRLLLLDPLVRLHGIDENHATEVAELLAYFRSLQRRLDLSVVLVHHTRKNAPGGAGQGLRGSGDIHAFGDSNLYLRRSGARLTLSSEHRAAPASPPVSLELVATKAAMTHLEVVAEQHDDGRQDLPEQVLALLGKRGPLTRGKLRDALAVKNERLGEALDSLERAGRVRRTPAGWQRLD